MDAPLSARRCAHPDCTLVAGATLSYDYRARTVWLDDDAPPHPSRHDLCLAHARRLRVPYGWRLVDRRGNDTVAVPAPAAG